MVAVDDALLALDGNVVEEAAEEVEFAGADFGGALGDAVDGAVVLFEEVVAVGVCPHWRGSPGNRDNRPGSPDARERAALHLGRELIEEALGAAFEEERDLLATVDRAEIVDQVGGEFLVLLGEEVARLVGARA
ncbi:MAG: hypothetical protein U0232_18405 [Thermomicrobiales bacterium]